MIVELAAVRLLAPWFGASSAVWTNVIGVVLLALSVGYLCGARLALSQRPERTLGTVLLLAGGFTVWLPWLAAPVAEFFVPRGVSLAESPQLFTWGSLAASCLLFGPSAAVLACVGPLATEIVQRRGVEHAGAAGGRVLFASTLGSLCGTFATTYLLVPRLGSSATFLGAGLLLLLPGLLLALKTRRGLAVGVLVLGTLALGFSRRAEPVPGEEMRVLASGESAYQFIRVVETGEGEAKTRLLQVNEGLDSYQSVWTPGTGLLGPGYYYDYFVLPTWWRGERDLSAFIVGLGAGTAWRVLEGAAPEVELTATGVEVDPRVVELGHEYFELPRDEPRLEILAGWDGRAALRTLEGPVDLFLLDAYANQSEIPAHLSSVEFFREVREKLAAGGYVAINVGGFGFEDPVVQALAGTLAAAFEQRVLGVQVPSARNVMLYAGRDGEVPGLDLDLAFAPPAIEALVAPVRLTNCSRWFEPSSEPLTDDRNAIERLQARSLERTLEEWLLP